MASVGHPLPLAWVAPAALLALFPAGGAAAEPFQTLSPGSVVPLSTHRVTIRRVEMLPLVENEYSRLFTYDTFDNPKLHRLREREKLDEVAAGGKSEFDRQVLLLDWTFRRFRKFGAPTAAVRGALEILDAVDQGHAFFCSHYAEVFVSVAASMGWVARPLALCRVNDAPGATEHAVTEIWSNQWRKWVMFDPTFALWVEKAGVPQNAYEIR
ncbi:MAG: transglutaminase domain-containing protein, partial [Armatimonadota bacterium]|nr:transglutaminase domain-containing protein [Armatimonadota bacterium]